MMGREVSIEAVRDGYILTNIEHPYGDTGGFSGKRVLRNLEQLKAFLEQYFEAHERKSQSRSPH